jgi:hypothetical protein
VNTKFWNWLLIGTLLFISTFFIFKYENAKSESVSLRLKLKLLSKEIKKKKAISWAQLKKEESITKKEVDTEAETVVSKKVVKKSDKPTSELAIELEEILKGHRIHKKEKLEEGLEIADELLRRNPNVYSSYKAKLILLLTLENTAKRKLDERTFQDLLDSMAAYDLSEERVLRKEAFMISYANEDIERLEGEIESIESELAESDDEAVINSLEEKISKKIDEIIQIEDIIEDGILTDEDYVNEDLVEIPLFRAMSKGHYDDVIFEAESILDEFPNSVRGHYFLILALKYSGETEEAQDLFDNNDLDEENRQKLRQSIVMTNEKELKNYWQRLRF